MSVLVAINFLLAVAYCGIIVKIVVVSHGLLVTKSKDSKRN